MNYQRLEKKVIYYMFINWIIAILILLAINITLFATLSYELLIIPMIFGVVNCLLIIAVLIFIPLKYKLYGYYYDSEKISFRGGILFKYCYIIPLTQIQDVSVLQGPIQSLFKIANLKIATAGSIKVIVNLNHKVALNIQTFIQNQVDLHKRGEE